MVLTPWPARADGARALQPRHDRAARRGRGARASRASAARPAAELARAGAAAAVAAAGCAPDALARSMAARQPASRRGERGQRRPGRGEHRAADGLRQVLLVDHVRRHRVDQARGTGAATPRARPPPRSRPRHRPGAPARSRRSRRAPARRARREARARARARRRGRARLPPPARARRRRSSSSSDASATAQASGLAMNVGPCISPPPSPRGDGVGDRGRAERRGERHVAAGQRLADAHHVRAHARRARRRTAPRCARSRWRSRRAPAAGRARRRSRAGQRDARRRVKAHPPRSLDDRLDDHAGELVRRALAASSRTRRSPALIEARVEAVRRTLGEHVLRRARPRTVLCMPRDGIAHRHRAGRVAVVAAANRQQARARAAPSARWYCRHSLIATSTETEPESAKNTRSRPAGASSREALGAGAPRARA